MNNLRSARNLETKQPEVALGGEEDAPFGLRGGAQQGVAQLQRVGLDSAYQTVWGSEVYFSQSQDSWAVRFEKDGEPCSYNITEREAKLLTEGLPNSGEFAGLKGLALDSEIRTGAIFRLREDHAFRLDGASFPKGSIGRVANWCSGMQWDSYDFAFDVLPDPSIPRHLTTDERGEPRTYNITTHGEETLDAGLFEWLSKGAPPELTERVSFTKANPDVQALMTLEKALDALDGYMEGPGRKTLDGLVEALKGAGVECHTWNDPKTDYATMKKTPNWHLILGNVDGRHNSLNLTLGDKNPANARPGMQREFHRYRRVVSGAAPSQDSALRSHSVSRMVDASFNTMGDDNESVAFKLLNQAVPSTGRTDQDIAAFQPVAIDPDAFQAHVASAEETLNQVEQEIQRRTERAMKRVSLTRELLAHLNDKADKALNG